MKERICKEKIRRKIYFLYVLEERISQLLQRRRYCISKAVDSKIMKTQDERAIPFEKILSVFQNITKQR